MIINNALPVTVVNTLTSPDGKYTLTLTMTMTTTTTLQYASVDGMIVDNSGGSIFDSLNTWSVAKGVIQFNGAPMAGTNSVKELVWTKGVLWQTNGTLWWYWDMNNQIWVAGSAPV
jgi:hypothetical protein